MVFGAGRRAVLAAVLALVVGCVVPLPSALAALPPGCGDGTPQTLPNWQNYTNEMNALVQDATGAGNQIGTTLNQGEQQMSSLIAGASSAAASGDAATAQADLTQIDALINQTLTPAVQAFQNQVNGDGDKAKSDAQSYWQTVAAQCQLTSPSTQSSAVNQVFSQTSASLGNVLQQYTDEYSGLRQQWGGDITSINQQLQSGCPSGETGTPPNCQPATPTPTQCPSGETGTPPNCQPATPTPTQCPSGETGTPPNCQPATPTPTQPDLTGSWSGYFTQNGSQVAMTAQITDAAGTLSGSASDNEGGAATLSGTLSGSTVQFTKQYTNPGSLPVTYTGVVSSGGQQMSGQWTTGSYSGTWQLALTSGPTPSPNVCPSGETGTPPNCQPTPPVLCSSSSAPGCPEPVPPSPTGCGGGSPQSLPNWQDYTNEMSALDQDATNAGNQVETTISQGEQQIDALLATASAAAGAGEAAQVQSALSQVDALIHQTLTPAVQAFQQEVNADGQKAKADAQSYWQAVAAGCNLTASSPASQAVNEVFTQTSQQFGPLLSQYPQQYSADRQQWGAEINQIQQTLQQMQQLQAQLQQEQQQWAAQIQQVEQQVQQPSEPSGSSLLNSLGLRAGELAGEDGSYALYQIESNGQKDQFSSWTVVLACGYYAGSQIMLPSGTLQALPDGPPITSTSQCASPLASQMAANQPTPPPGGNGGGGGCNVANVVDPAISDLTGTINFFGSLGSAPKGTWVNLPTYSLPWC